MIWLWHRSQRREMDEDPIIPLDSKTLKEIEALSAQ